MQPYFLPYLGYFQLIKNSNIFVLADEYQFTTRGWINRNRAILNNQISTFTIPVSAAGKNINDKRIADMESTKSLKRRMIQSYRNSPNFANSALLLDSIFSLNDLSLQAYIHNSIKCVCKYLEIETTIVKLSEIDYNRKLKGEDRVVSICKNLGATKYLNSEGGKNIYKVESFAQVELGLEFIEHVPIKYNQNLPGFTPRLSVVDLIFMLNSRIATEEHLKSFVIHKPEDWIEK
jgi:hypothetical protein